MQELLFPLVVYSMHLRPLLERLGKSLVRGKTENKVYLYLTA